MLNYLEAILDWSEIWSLMIPLTVLFLRRDQPAYLKPVVVYLWLALIINVVVIILWQHNIGKRSVEMISNNPYYNVHSIVRFGCFTAFFFFLKQPFFGTIKKVIPAIFLVFVLVNFSVFENFLNFYYFSGTLLTIEAYLLLVYCLLYYLSQLKVETFEYYPEKAFWIVTGLCFYVVINFFVFLFYIPLLDLAIETKDEALQRFTTDIWNIHNIAFILFCIFIAKAFYVSKPIGYNN